MSVSLQVRSNTARNFPQKGDDGLFSEVTSWANDVTSEINKSVSKLNAGAFTHVVGSSADVTNGDAGYSDIATAITAASAGDRIFIRNNTYTPSAQIDITKTLTIIGEGDSAIIAGNNIASGSVVRISASGCTLENFKITQGSGTPDYAIENTASKERNYINLKADGTFAVASYLNSSVSGALTGFLSIDTNGVAFLGESVELESIRIEDQTTPAYNLIIQSDSDGTILTANRTLTIDVNNEDHTLDLSENLTIGDGADVTITAEDAASSIVMDNANFEVENLNATQRSVKVVVGTDANATLQIEGTSGAINQDLTTDAAATFTGATLSGVTASRALTTNGSSVVTASATTATELGYVNGVTSAIQTQLDGKEGTLTNSAGLAAALSDETGTGLVVFNNSPVLTTPQINDTSSDHQYIVAVSELAADRNITLPLLGADDEFVFKDHAVTMTNKTLTSPVLNTSVSGTAVLDEDNMASDSATQLATQQSIKAYADTKLPEPTGNGIAVRTGSDTATNRTIQATADEISVSNGDGVSGDPTIGIADNPVLPGTGAVQVPSGTTANRPGSPTNGDFRYNTTTSKFEGYQGGAWGELGAGSGVNYITDTDAEGGVGSWATYADAADTDPVDGTGGSATITWTQNTTTPLRDTADFKFTKDAANRQGEGASYDFTVDRADLGQVMKIEFDYDASDTDYADDDIRIKIYDKDGTSLIDPVGRDLKGGKGTHIAYFQTDSANDDYRLIIHQSSTNAAAYDIYFDNISVGPVATANEVGGNGIIAARYHNDAGTSITNSSLTIVDFEDKDFDTNAAVTTGGSWKFTAPESGKYQVNARCTLNAANFDYGIIWRVSLYKNGSDYAVMGESYNRDDGTLNKNLSAGGATIVDLDAGDYIDIRVIHDHSTGLTLRAVASANYVSINKIDGPSAATNGSVIAASVEKNAAQTITNASWQKVTWDVVEFDTSGSMDVTTNNRFNVPSSGYYSITGNLYYSSNATGQRLVGIYVNGTQTKYEGGTTSASNPHSVDQTALLKLNKGDYVEIWTYQDSGGNLDISNADEPNYFTVHKIQSPAVNAVSVSQAVNDNLIINGNMDYWQRGTAFAGVGDVYTADRWAVVGTSAVVWDVNRSTTIPTVAQSGWQGEYSLQADVTTADASVAAGDVEVIRQFIEGKDFQEIHQQQVTFSFWVYATKTGTSCVAFLNSAQDRSYIAEYTISQTLTWEKKTVTFTCDTSGTWLFTNGKGMEVAFCLMGGSTYQGTASTWQAGQLYCTSNQVNHMDNSANVFHIAQVKLERGNAATRFKRAGDTIAGELEKCQRYYQKSYNVDVDPGASTTNGAVRFYSYANGINWLHSVQFATAMRANSGSSQVYGTTGVSGSIRDITNSANRTSTVNTVGTSGLTVYHSGSAIVGPGTEHGFHWVSDQEL